VDALGRISLAVGLRCPATRLPTTRLRRLQTFTVAKTHKLRLHRPADLSMTTHPNSLDTLEEAYRVLHSVKPFVSRWDMTEESFAEARKPIEYNGPYFKAQPRKHSALAPYTDQLQRYDDGFTYDDDGFIIDNDYYDNPMPDVDARTEHVQKLLEQDLLDLQVYGAESPLHFDFVRSATELEDGDLEACFKLIEYTSGHDYRASSIGWKPKKKREEMKDRDMMYLLVKHGDSDNGGIMGFISFMITTDDPPRELQEVVYIYEVHLADSLRGRGLGSRLIRFVEEASRRCGIMKTMLTVFKSNSGARGLYEKLGYSKDDCSPEDKVVRRRVIEADYLIMSKILV
jgi:ribosomal protein S18 acetylase RimI-like enzyme